MNIYMTTGTFNFLKSIENKYINENMVTMANENGALLLHETMGKSEFKEPRKYEVLESIGDIKKEGIAVLNNIPVTDEGRPLFEHQCKNQIHIMGKVPGLMAVRLLRPLKSNTYVILTIWENAALYQKWQQSDLLLKAGNYIEPQQKIFTSAPYTSKYSITK